MQCQESHPAYCDVFAVENYIGRQQRVSIRQGDKEETPWTRFFAQSSFAQYSVVDQASIVNAKNLLHSQDELKLFAPLGCGFQTGMGAILNTSCAGPADVVMILGLGAVGMGALMVSNRPSFTHSAYIVLTDSGQTSHIQGCKAIIAVDKFQDRLELSRTLGATHTINTTSPDFTTLSEAARAYFPAGVSIVIETTGVPFLIEQGLEATHARGKLVCIGVPPVGYNMGVDMIKHINVGTPFSFRGGLTV